ncbi:ATP-binding protein [Schlesneria sp. T3-172]|uniref:ATP-binding protein n=1 Tax=Schlesneria sphaerica TaxID=3373610 RepID=UPI0037C5F50F
MSENSPLIEPQLSDCERELIRVPGSIQPHGVLLALSVPDHRILQASESTLHLLGKPAAELLRRPLSDAIGNASAAQLSSGLESAPAGTRPALLRTLSIVTEGRERMFHALAHRADGVIVLELELSLADDVEVHHTPQNYSFIDAFTLRAEAACSIDELSRLTCEEVRHLTDFDRALIYRFDEEWNGTVIGEDGSGRLPSYLHHRFPASDIPAQARELYRLNRLRLIPDANYRPVPITPALNPITGRTLDLSFSALRSVSPVHVEYMKHMETAASMSVSILRDGRLWGLISCHHREPKSVSFPVRSTCDLIARVFSLRLSALEHSDEFQRRIEVRHVFANLLGAMADRGDFARALAERSPDLLKFVNASGAAVLTDGECLLSGETPSEEQVREIASWLFQNGGREVFHTDKLASVYSPALHFKDKASGLIAIAVSKLHPSYVIWFRPEVIQTIQWGGDPTKPAETNGEQIRLHPRRSFDTWRETVRDRSISWHPSEIEGAVELRNAIVGTVLRKAEELAELNEELLRSNSELEAFSYSVSHDLRAPLRHIVGYAEMLRESKSAQHSEKDQRCISTIIESSEYAGKLVDKLLGYSRLGRAELQRSWVNMNALVGEIQNDVMRDAESRAIQWKLSDLPAVSADLPMLRMAVRDLLSNAVKYTRNCDNAVIQVGCSEEHGEFVFFVKDNGVGFDMAYKDKLFGVFQRLHKWEDYEGTGIGLANVRRVIERHGGRTWGEGEENKGATFYFTLPKPSN